MNTKTLYRPVGIKELELVANLNWKGFPPRLDWQPIFYPVLNKDYAAQIASEWNTHDAFSGYCGIVTQFEIDEDYIHQFNVENVGAEIHNELWIPAAELENFNRHIVDEITIIDVFFGEAFIIPEHVMIRQSLLNFKK